MSPIRLFCGLLIGVPAWVSAGFNFFDPGLPGTIPARLSQTGIYADIASKVTDTALHFFEINAPLWSDGAAKLRWVILPPGGSIPYEDATDLFAYPDSAVFVKAFLLERIQGDSASRVYWETRLLVNRKDDSGRNVWHGLSYKWNEDASDAFLVSQDSGFDTVFHYRLPGPGRPEGYKKWHFPSAGDCNVCHTARHVLGFLPAQLKRTAPGRPGTDQVLSLFDQGVFTGTRPTPAQLAARWKGIHESIAPGLHPDRRFAILDTMARSYIGGNCSGCHGSRGISQGLAPEHVNYDFHRLRPMVEFSHLPTNTSSLDLPDSAYTGMFGRRYMVTAAAQSGLDTSAGSAWDLALPTGSDLPPALVYPGFPAYSTLLYRQLARRAPWRDSGEARSLLVSEGDPQGLQAWLFSQPWGSGEWRAALDAHGLPARSFMSFQEEVAFAGSQMPPINASFIPDTAALKVMAEWIKSYRVLQAPDGIKDRRETGSAKGRSGFAPALRGRYISFPLDRPERVSLLDLRGRRVPLEPAGPGRYFVPSRFPRGVYLLGMEGGRFFATVLE